MNYLYTCAAFISAGLHRDVGLLDEARDAAGTGCFELVTTAAAYADFVYEAAEVGYKIVGEFPGVYDYEVSEEFGVWYAKATIEKGAIPDVADACDVVRNLAFDFFGDSDATKEDMDRLLAALAAMPNPEQPSL